MGDEGHGAVFRVFVALSQWVSRFLEGVIRPVLAECRKLRGRGVFVLEWCPRQRMSAQV